MPEFPEAPDRRLEYVRQIKAAIRPDEMTSREEVKDMVEALALMAATAFLKLRGIPHSVETIDAFSLAAIEGMERRAALETN
jgi:hypothetical protein